MGKVRKLLMRYKELQAEKQLWHPIYELISEYVMYRKKTFNYIYTPGQSYAEDVFDSTAPDAAALMMSALLGALWPNGAKSIRIAPPQDLRRQIELATGGEQDDTDEIKQYYQFVTEEMARYMDNPKSGLRTALEEYMWDQTSFGISGILIEERDDNEVPIRYKALDAKSMCVEEDQDGNISGVFIERSLTLRQAVAQYGVEALNKKHREEFEKGIETKTRVKVLQIIEPRLDGDPNSFGSKDMPIASIHIDIENEKMLRNAGYDEHPAPVSRFWKAMGEKQGRSPAMNALPAILEANAIGEAWPIAIEKTLDPPLLVKDDGSLGNGIIDTSARGITVVNTSGRITNDNPIEPMFTVGDLQWTALRRTELIETIKNHFFIDRLMDLNNEKRMTLGEANIRNELRGQTLNPVYSRQIEEQFVPLTDRTFNVLYRRGKLGVERGSLEAEQMLARGEIPYYIPDIVVERMKNGQEVYQIEFISPAVRIMHTEELQGIERTLQVGVEVSAVQPEILDNLNLDKTIRHISDLTGAPHELLNSMDVVQKARKARKELQERQLALEEQRMQSETARNAGQAVSSVQNTGGGNKAA
jgi:hypothetical protein